MTKVLKKIKLQRHSPQRTQRTRRKTNLWLFVRSDEGGAHVKSLLRLYDYQSGSVAFDYVDIITVFVCSGIQRTRLADAALHLLHRFVFALG